MSLLIKRIQEFLRPSPIGAKASEMPGARVPFQQTLHKLAEARKLTEPPIVKVTPAIPFSDVLAAYFADPACKAASHELAFTAVGKGFYHSVDPEYEKADDVEKLIDEFNEKANLDALLVVGAVEIAAFGNHLWFIGDLDKTKLLDVERPIKPIPLAAIESIEGSYLSNQVKVLDKVKAYKLWSTWGGGQLNPERVVHFRWNPVGVSPFGFGIIHSLLDEASFDGETRMCYLEMKWRIEQRMIDIHEKYAGPDQMWWMPKAKSEDVTSLRALLKSRPKEGARFIWSGEKGGEIFTVSLDPRARFDFYVDHIMNQNYLGLETPLAKALTTPGFTEACHSADTLTLTENGWKHYWEVGEEERIASFNLEKGTVEFQVPDALHVYDYDGELVHFSSRRADVLVTRNHRMLRRTRSHAARYNHWRVQKAEELTELKEVDFRALASWPEREEKVHEVPGVTGKGLRRSQALSLQIAMDVWLEFLGYFISEGGLTDIGNRGGKCRVKYHQVTIHQKSPEKTGKIRACLAKLGIPFKEYYIKRFDAVEFRIKGGKRLWLELHKLGDGFLNKRIPREYFALSKRQLKILFDALILGDGSVKKSGCILYSTSSEGLAYDVQELGMRLGYVAKLKRHVDKRGDRHPNFIVSMSRRNPLRVRRIRKIKYKGKVYCFSVRNGFFLTMRNGKATIQGNSIRGAIELHEPVIFTMQRFIKREVEKLWNFIIAEAGYDPVKAHARLNWGSPETPEILMADMLKAAELGLIRVEEFRKNAMKFGWELWEAEAQAEQKQAVEKGRNE